MADNSPKPFVFVLMPFANEFNDIYELGIKAACVEAGAYCERVDEQIFEGSMLERILYYGTRPHPRPLSKWRGEI
jgi:hypothetical protein